MVKMSFNHSNDGDAYPVRVLGLYSFDMKHSLKMAVRCRNMYETDICHKSYFKRLAPELFF